PADYDGDGKTDPAVFRDGTWYILESSTDQPRYAYWGLATDTLVPADYDGDGKADFAVWRESDSTWYVAGSRAPSSPLYVRYGGNGDFAIPSAYIQ
ncbi:MAG TPA: VCBS repeat-containing protein, partial [Pyrinomonadaceae bacterium]